MAPVEEIPAIVSELREHFDEGVQSGPAARATELRQLRRLLTEREDEIDAALAADLGKPSFEAYGTEVGFTIAEIDHALAHLGEWVTPTKVRLPLMFRPGSARVVPQPLGVVLIIAPWNYPVQLLLTPLVAALAAGNTVVLKPSEVAPATSSMFSRLIPEYLDSRVVRLVEGGPAETTVLLNERFDHIFYTGNGNVARVVMRAAAEHLTPVTLELGGKSPAIVTADANVDVSARRIAWGKFVNAGQTCVAPDYVLVHRDVEDSLLGALLRSIHDFFGDEPSSSNDYGRIVNDRHFDRLVGLLDGDGYEAVVTGGTFRRDERYLAPTVLAGVSPEAGVMGEEIFGPILPVVAVDSVDDAVRFVNARPHPLALYVFSDDEPAAQRIVERTTSGGAAINHTMMHVGVNALPFGGVGASGMGSYHGRAGFDTFSHHRSVLTKPATPDPPVVYPPYKGWKEKLLRRFL